MRGANQHDLDLQVEQIKCVIEIMQHGDAHALFDTCNEILKNGVEHYSDEEILNVYKNYLPKEAI